jgi:hypothetical protein
MGNSIHSPGAVLVRRELLDLSGGFDGSLAHSEDWDMWIRLARLGPIGFAPTFVLNYRKHSANRSGDRAGLRAVRGIVQAKAFASVADNHSEARALDRTYRVFQLDDARSKLTYAIADIFRLRGKSAFMQVRHALGHIHRAVVGHRV